jgi:hypothetical protein
MLQFRWQTGHMPTGAMHGQFATERDALIYVHRFYPRAELAGEAWMSVDDPGSADQFTYILNHGLDNMIQPIARLVRTPPEVSHPAQPTEEYQALPSRLDE